MKNVIRAVVITLTLTGAVASAHTSHYSSTQISKAKATAFPTPMCRPDDPNACGIK